MTSEENGKDLIFEGYLKKQKDKMVQSVREKEDRNHEYLFEIVMKNGKKKVLAAESSDLRAVWMEFLWKAMQLPGPGKKNSACTWHDIPHLIQRAASLCPNTTKREDSTGSLYSTDTQSEDYTPDTVHLASPVRSRQTSSTASDLDESSNMRCSNITSSSEEGESLDNEATTASQGAAGDQSEQEVETGTVPSLKAKATDRVDCLSGVYNVPKPVSEESTVPSGVQAPCEELFTSIPEVNLLDEIISGFSRSTSCWLDSQQPQNKKLHRVNDRNIRIPSLPPQDGRGLVSCGHALLMPALWRHLQADPSTSSDRDGR
ncbi:uncharacterized protein LOC132379909 isoform X5 [Hypanus sabinus]|uniref:uncharacterized protein LOC132379909 isoform X5 n=1 Tax=Hypanus sabinus TaxID=79690 RepID=UPI0028C3FA53|nr:uncharacterized protein LOC132379909 isoform X5 [Hypanus sabinus]